MGLEPSAQHGIRWTQVGRHALEPLYERPLETLAEAVGGGLLFVGAQKGLTRLGSRSIPALAGTARFAARTLRVLPAALLASSLLSIGALLYSFHQAREEGQAGEVDVLRDQAERQLGTLLQGALIGLLTEGVFQAARFIPPTSLPRFSCEVRTFRFSTSAGTTHSLPIPSIRIHMMSAGKPGSSITAEASPEVHDLLVKYRPNLGWNPGPGSNRPMPRIAETLIPMDKRAKASFFETQDGEMMTLDQRMDPQGVLLRDYWIREAKSVISGFQRGERVAVVTGVSGSGKSEVFQWRLISELELLGERPIGLDLMKMFRKNSGPQIKEIISRIESELRPTVYLFDESCYTNYGSAMAKTPHLAEHLAHFLSEPNRKVVLVGGGRISIGKQTRDIYQGIVDPLRERRLDLQVQECPLQLKPFNLAQTYRHLGLNRTDALNAEDKLRYLSWVVERCPQYPQLLVHYRVPDGFMSNLPALKKEVGDLGVNSIREELGFVL